MRMSLATVKRIFLFFSVMAVFNPVFSQERTGKSVYAGKFQDENAVYFNPASKADVSDEFQQVINKLKLEQNLGIIFIPEGTYFISKTIYIPAAIRLIGYGKNRPLFVLKKNSPGFQAEDQNDKGKASYMFWFTGSVVESKDKINDANAGTFYSALTNINLKIEDGNPAAVALRTHYAQHSFVSHCDIRIGNGKAGMFDIGNYMEDVRFFGGEYGIYTTKASPGWQFMMLDSYFEGQRKAAVKTREAGLTIVRMVAKNVPAVIQIEDNFWEKLYLEDAQLINVSGPAISFDNEDNAHMQINMRNVNCMNVPVLVSYLRSHQQTKGTGKTYQIKKYVYGLQQDDLNENPEIATTFEYDVLQKLPAPVTTNIPELPSTGKFVNIKTLGAKGDGETDDTKAIQNAVEKYPNIYFPQGYYRIKETIKLKSNTVLMGFHPMATQLMVAESTEAFSGFGSPVPIIESPMGGSSIITGIGLNTGEYNYRAVACKWMAGPQSMINDVKFVGGHGTMKRGPYSPWKGNSNQGRKPSAIPGLEPAWDTQYWSLWITNGGGGIFNNIWTANTFSCSGIYVSDTSTPACIYALSVEHHVRNEVRFSHVSNWKVYALQLEEESRESSQCQPMEIDNCSNMLFANLYMFRVIRMKVPYPYSIRTWNCKNLEILNIHNYSQIKYTTDNPLYDVNTDIEVRPQELARLFISGNTSANNSKSIGPVKMIAQGFEFAEGLCSDSKGNVYFSEQRMKRIYKWDAETSSISLLTDFPWEPLSLACDSKDNLLVVFRYHPQFGRIVNGEQEKFDLPADAAGTSYSGWGNSGWATSVYSINPEDPEKSIQLLERIPVNSVKQIHKVLYPSNRWRDSHDFNNITINKNEFCFVAPDGVTVIPDCYDLTRSVALVEAFPGKPLYVSDEYDKRTVRLNVDNQGILSNLVYFAEKGEFSAVPDNEGNVYVADGQIYKYDKFGKQTGTVMVPERPSTLIFGGKNMRTLFITGRKALYSVELNAGFTN